MTHYDPYAPSVSASTPPGPEAAYYPGMETPTGQALQPYSVQQPYGVSPAMEHPQAVVILVLGILGFFTGLTGPFAWYLGNKATRVCQAGLYRMTDALRVGRILGIVTTILTIVAVVFSVGAIVLWGLFITALSGF